MLRCACELPLACSEAVCGPLLLVCCRFTADVTFLRAQRAPAEGDDEAYIAGAPDLVVEIASPSQYRPEMGAKAWLWLQRGARLVWVVWPQRHQVDVWTPGQDAPVSLTIADALDGGEVLPGLTYRLDDLFS